MTFLIVPGHLVTLRSFDRLYGSMTAAIYNDDHITLDFSGTQELNEDLLLMMFTMLKQTWGLKRISEHVTIIFKKPKHRLKSLIVNALRSEVQDD